MLSIQEYIQNIQYQDIVNEYLCDIIAEDIINESFKSSLLLELAKAIDKAETYNKERYKENYKRWEENGRGWGKPNKTTSFTSIFGPVTQTSRYGSKTSGLQGIKWSDITDNDFVKYNTDDKEFKKLIKAVYAHKDNAEFICCEPGTKNIVYFIKGYNPSPKDNIQLYEFINTNKWNSGTKEKKATKNKYGERSLKVDEALNLIDGLDIYALKITDNMKTSYKSLLDDRKNAQKGVINYDKESLEKMLKEQKARYKALVEEMKALNLQTNKEDFFDDIVNTNNEVVELYKKITSNPKNMDMNFDLGDLMRYISYAYEGFYKSMQSSRSGDIQDEKYNGSNYSKYYRERAKDDINMSKDYLDKAKKIIEKIKSQII